MTRLQKVEIRLRLLPLPKKGKVHDENRFIEQLFEEYPDQTFWNKISPPFQIESFADFFAPKGVAFLRKAWRGFKFELPAATPKSKFLDYKVGIDFTKKKGKPRTIREFLNG